MTTSARSSIAFKSLDGYRGEVKVDPPLPAGLKNPRKMAQVTRRIDAPIERVYQRLIDLPGRLNWIEGATKVEMANDQTQPDRQDASMRPGR